VAITVARDTIVCPGCGGKRVVTRRQVRRVRQGVHDGRCVGCRGIFSPTQRFSDNDLHFWLKAFDAPCPADVPVRQFIVAGGAPPELVELARSIFSGT